MLHSQRGSRGLVVAPHHLASQSGIAVLREGGNALEAMIAAAATIAVVYPHMNGLGGDSFWLVHQPGMAPVAIDACGRAGNQVSPEVYRARGCEAIPPRGPLAANTVAGTVSGWNDALALAQARGGEMPLARLLEDAIHYADNGVPVTGSQARLTHAKLEELRGIEGFKAAFLPQGWVPEPGERFVQPRIANTLRLLVNDGLDSFYRGPLGRTIAADLARAGCPITPADLESHRAERVSPLSITLKQGKVFNFPPPTQGLASLLILAVFERLGVSEAEGFAHIHGLVESTKQAFMVRDREITDPDFMRVNPEDLLRGDHIDTLAARINRERALAWPQPSIPGDTVWLGAIDSRGCAVSFIQSIYWEFGSGVVLQDSGIHWQNRGSSFRLADGSPNLLVPGKKPFHTLNPALAHLDDGRIMVYGTMGGEGQPQTQSAVFSRYAGFGGSLSQAVTGPRWLLGRTWGAESTTLKLESRFDPGLVAELSNAGHEIEVVGPFDEMMGHAGAGVRHRDGSVEGAADPRSDGTVATY